MPRSLRNPSFESLDTDVLNSADLENAASGQVPKSNGDGTYSMGVAGGLQHIQTNTPSGVSETTFTSGIDSTYTAYKIEWKLVPASDGAAQLQVSNDGGSTWQSGASAYRYAIRGERSNGNSALRSSTGDSVIAITRGSTGSGAGQFAAGTITMTAPADSALKTVFGTEFSELSDIDELEAGQGGGVYDTAEAINGVRINFSSGNIESGTVSLYGVVN